MRALRSLMIVALIVASSLAPIACGGSKMPVQASPENVSQQRAVQAQIATYADLIKRAGEMAEQAQLIEIAAYKDGLIPAAQHVTIQQGLLVTARAVQSALTQAKDVVHTPDVLTSLRVAFDSIDKLVENETIKITNAETRDRVAVYLRGLRSLLDALVKIPNIGGTIAFNVSPVSFAWRG